MSKTIKEFNKENKKGRSWVSVLLILFLIEGSIRLVDYTVRNNMDPQSRAQLENSAMYKAREGHVSLIWYYISSSLLKTQQIYK